LKKLLVPVALILVVLLILTGCGKSSSTTTAKPATTTAATSTTVKPTSASPTVTTAASTTAATTATTSAASTVPAGVKTGGTINMFLPSDTTSFYPATMAGQTDGQLAFSLETLFRFDKQYNLVPLLATAWKADAAAKTITITLRQGIKFQDGSDFNADVCKWNMDQYRAGTRPELKLVTSVDVVDPYTVRLNLSTFDNTIVTSLGNASDAGRMISRQSFEKNGGIEWASRNPVGTGPFQFVSVTKDVSMIWKRFDGYWGGKPYLDGIVMKRYADPTVALLDFKAGNLDILGGLSPQNAVSLKSDKTRYKVVVPPYGQVPALAGFGSDPNSMFSKLEMRQAISYSLDVKTWADATGLGFWTVQNSWAVPGTASYNDAIVGYPYNPDKAKQLVAQATGSSAPYKTTLNFYANSQAVIDENVGLQSYLNKGGFDVTLNPLQRPAYSDMASNGKGWSGIIRQQGYSHPDPLIKYAGVMAGQEYKGSILPQELVDAYQKALTATDQTSKISLTKQFLALAVDKYCISSYMCVQPSPVAKSVVLHDDVYGEDPFSYINPFAWLSR
jgi:peptide/nickel transport system substrate-binding protein